MERLRLDLAYAVRSLATRPWVTLLIVATLGVGISVNTVVFSLINGLLFKDAPFPNRDRLAWILARGAGTSYGELTFDEYAELARSGRAYEGIAAEGRLALALQRGTSSEPVWTLAVSDNYFAVVGLQAERGRLFEPLLVRESPLVAVVSRRFADERFGPHASLAGRTLTLNGQIVAVVGVLPDRTRGFSGIYTPDLWVPLSALDALGLRQRREATAPWLSAAGLLRSSSTPARADAELARLSAHVPRPAPAPGTRRFVPAMMADGHPDLAQLRPLSIVLVGAVGFVLLLACFNVAGLQLARAAERQREMGIRASLGASHGDLVRLLLAESGLLALASGIAGLVVSWWSYDLLSAFRLPAPTPQDLDLRLDVHVIWFTAALVVAAGIVPALAPAFQLRALDVIRVLKQEGSTFAGARLAGRRVLLFVEVSGSTLLLVLATLFLRSFARVSLEDPGFDTRQVVVATVDPSEAGRSEGTLSGYYERALERLRTTPGVTAAAMTDRVPFGMGSSRAIEVAPGGSACPAAGCPRAGLVRISRGYFESLGIRVIAGDAMPIEGPPLAREAVIVDRMLASALWPGRSPIGQWLTLDRSTRAQVVGLVGDVEHIRLGVDSRPEIYRLLRDDELPGSQWLVARVGPPAPTMISTIRAALTAVDPAVPPHTLQTMSGHLALAEWPSRTLAWFSLICAAIAGALATSGLFGLVHRSVTQRLPEFGVRAALGASRAQLLAQVLGEGTALAVPGVLAGLAVAALAGRFLHSILVGVSPAHPSTYVLAALAQAAAVLLACALPARVAARVDPVRVLRRD